MLCSMLVLDVLMAFGAVEGQLVDGPAFKSSEVYTQHRVLTTASRALLTPSLPPQIQAILAEEGVALFTLLRLWLDYVGADHADKISVKWLLSRPVLTQQLVDAHFIFASQSLDHAVELKDRQVDRVRQI